MIKVGFTQSAADPYLFIRKDDKGVMYVIIFVDDGFFVGDQPAVDSMIAQLEAEGLKLKVKHSLEYYLSCQVLFSKDEKRSWHGNLT
jgi:hypothetical protein